MDSALKMDQSNEEEALQVTIEAMEKDMHASTLVATVAANQALDIIRAKRDGQIEEEPTEPQIEAAKGAYSLAIDTDWSNEDEALQQASLSAQTDAGANTVQG